MPSGNPTIKAQPLDLGSFLERKRKPLSKWLQQTGINSESALQNFLQNPEWSVTDSLLELIRATFIIESKILPTESVTLKIDSVGNKNDFIVNQPCTTEQELVSVKAVESSLDMASNEFVLENLKSVDYSSELAEEITVSDVVISTKQMKGKNR